MQEDDRILDEVKLIPYEQMWCGKCETLGTYIGKIVEAAGETTINDIRKYLLDMCSISTLKSELKILYKNGYISDYKNKIKWIYDTEEANRTKYKREVGE